ncbi:MAG: BamA/TamA family outer membrane protein [Burkholderiaceae bacterium]
MTPRSGARAAAALVAAAVLSGCANLVFLGPKPEPAKAEAPVATLERAEYRVEVQAPDALRALLTTYLDLSRFQNAPATEGITPAELERLVRAAPAQARSLLETAGYFSADVQVERGPTQSGELPLLRVIVVPGPQARVANFTLDVHGALDEAARRGDPAAVEEVATLRRQWPLQAGRAFRQSAWTDAKNGTLAQLRARGYAAASWNETHARVDARDNSVALAVTIDSGPLFLIGEIRIEGLQRYDAEAVRKLAYFEPGTPYTEKTLLDFQERVQKVGLFEGAAVELDANPETASAAPVLVKLKELPLQQATAGVGYSANTGPRLTFEHTHRRVFGSRWVAKNKFELGAELKSWSGELISHPLDGLYRNLLGGAVSQLRSADQVLNAWSARVGRTQDTPRIERLYFFELTQAKLEGEQVGSLASAASYNYHWVYRDIDSVLLPTRGLTTSAQAAAGYARGSRTLLGVTESDRGPFGRLYVRMTWYQPLGDAWYATLRGEAGQVFTRNVVGIPETLLFRAGGDDSVRGYAYRTLGPTVGGVVSSGRTLLTASAEIARPISARYPAFWWAAFVDAGNAADRFSELHPALGYGVGVRWRSPVGPLRVDLAYGQETRRVRAHLSIGIAF